MANELERKLERYKKITPPMYRPGVNIFVTALIETLAKADSDVEIQIVEAGKQIFVETAEGKFLDTLGNNVGVDRPIAINLSDEKFRELIPTLSFKPKQIKETMYDILDVFWGPLFSRANITGLAQEPYDLGNIGALTGTLTFRNGDITVNGVGSFFTGELTVGDFIKFGSDDNTEFRGISQIISDTKLLLAAPYLGGTPIAPQIGTGDFYQARTLTVIVDGGVETEIKLTPQTLTNPSVATAAEVAVTINAQTRVDATTETITSSVIENSIEGTKFVNIRTDTPGSLGSLRITGGTANIFAFGVQDFDGTSVFVSNTEAAGFAVTDSVVVGSNLSSLTTTISAINADTPIAGISEVVVADSVTAFLLVDDNFIYKSGHLGLGNKEILIAQLLQKTVIFEINPKELIVRIPSTIPALRRTLRGSSHGRAGYSGEITAIDNFAKTVTVDYDLEPSLLNFFAGKLFSSQLNEFTIISNTAGLTGVTIQFSATDDLSVLSTITGENGFVILDDIFIGSFIFDPSNATFTTTKDRATLQQTLSKGSVFPSINVSGAGDVADAEGFIIFDFGRPNQEGPVQYRGRPNNNTLLLDPAYIFEKNHISGELINVLISTLKATTPRITGEDFAVYVTDFAGALLAVQDLLRQTKAAGVNLVFIIDTPQYLWTTARAKLVPEVS